MTDQTITKTDEPVYVVDSLIAEDIDAYLEQHEHKTMLRFITCGSVDDGKSTLIGRLLYDSKMIFEDQLDALQSDSKKVGTQGQEIDFALLVDGLAAEREQGITRPACRSPPQWRRMTAATGARSSHGPIAAFPSPPLPGSNLSVA